MIDSIKWPHLPRATRVTSESRPAYGKLLCFTRSHRFYNVAVTSMTSSCFSPERDSCKYIHWWWWASSSSEWTTTYQCPPCCRPIIEIAIQHHTTRSTVLEESTLNNMRYLDVIFYLSPSFRPSSQWISHLRRRTSKKLSDGIRKTVLDLT